MLNRLNKKIAIMALTLALTFTMSVPAFALTKPAKPALTAKAAYSYNGTTGKVLYSKRANTRLDPLSTTKLLTAYIVMKSGIDLDTVVTVSKETANTPWRGLHPLKKGEKIKVKYLLYFALLPSENDAASALGQAVSGNKKAFAKLMNSEAKSLGCTNSKFTNAHGCIENNYSTVRDNYSTVHDMALITQAAFKYSYLRKICSTKTYTIPKTNKCSKRSIWLTNPFFFSTAYKTYSIMGGKTGTWDYRNAALVEYSKQNGNAIYTVVMKDTTAKRYTDTKKLIKYSKSYIQYQTALAGTTVSSSN